MNSAGISNTPYKLPDEPKECRKNIGLKVYSVKIQLMKNKINILSYFTPFIVKLLNHYLDKNIKNLNIHVESTYYIFFTLRR